MADHGGLTDLHAQQLAAASRGGGGRDGPKNQQVFVHSCVAVLNRTLLVMLFQAGLQCGLVLHGKAWSHGVSSRLRNFCNNMASQEVLWS